MGIQQYIKQHLFTFRSVLNDEIVQQNIIPTLLCYNDKFYGPGINRSSPERLIAVSRGGEILLPQINKSMKGNFLIPQIFNYENNINGHSVNDHKKNVLSMFKGYTLKYNLNDNIHEIGAKILKSLKNGHKCLVDL